MLCFWLPGAQSAYVGSDDAQLGRFKVAIHSASGVPKRNNDPYVILFFLGEECGRTSIRYDTSSPTWEETLTCSTCLHHEDERPVLRVYDKDSNNADDYINGVNFALSTQPNKRFTWDDGMTLRWSIDSSCSYKPPPTGVNSGSSNLPGRQDTCTRPPSWCDDGATTCDTSGLSITTCNFVSYGCCCSGAFEGSLCAECPTGACADELTCSQDVHQYWRMGILLLGVRNSRLH